jgi:hypothetical protein
MAQVLTAVAVCALAGFLLWRYKDQLFERPGIKVMIRLDKAAPGAQLIWDVTNTATEPITLTKLVVHSRRGPCDTIPSVLPATLASKDRLIVPTDVDWSLLAAKWIAVADAQGHEHHALGGQLAAIQDQLRQLIDRRVSTSSARDFLSGAADLALGVAILGLGFFMLMWAIATG